MIHEVYHVAPTHIGSPHDAYALTPQHTWRTHV